MQKRATSLFLVICAIFSLITLKIISLNSSTYAGVEKTNATRTVTVGESRGNIYDTNLRRLVATEEKKIAVAKPGAYSLKSIEKLVNERDTEEIIDEIANGYPVMFETYETIENDDIMTFSVPLRYTNNNNIASHIIGYLDGEGNAVSGIEKAYDDFLKESSGKLSVTFNVDANGKILSGFIPTINDENFNSKEGVVLTLDEEIQRVCEKAMDDGSISSGACVVLNCADAAITACVSRPDFDIGNIAAALNDANSPLINRVFTAYPVGSVFKPILSAFMLENDQSIADYNCTGEITIGDTSYGCNNKTAHGKIGLDEALQVSCNTFFINMTKKADGEKLYDFCISLGFSQSTHLAGDMYSPEGNLPTADELRNKGARANFSFGQGRLTVTPLQMAAAYLAIADGGYYRYPYLVKGTLDENGFLTENEKKPQSKVMSKETSEKMRELLQKVVTEGNAYNGEAKTCTTAGKTGTAQSGIYDINGKEILRTWFVGFFPASDPLYVVAVMKENGTSGGADCGPVFSQIADDVMEIIINRAN